MSLPERLSDDRKLANRYREALLRIVQDPGDAWCKEYAMCDHIGCEKSHEHIELAQAALAIEEVMWPLKRDRGKALR